jgi:PPK2 family polyphosphate:nucleotide phosphotransferase
VARVNINRYRVRPGESSPLARVHTDDTGPYDDRKSARKHLEKGTAKLDALQERLYAQGEHALLLVFQGMDASGKDSAIEHVMSGVNPQGTDVHAFKQPSSEELGHDFLWRNAKAVPARGRIGIFNRSHYEEVIVVRVHPEWLGAQHLPAGRITPNLWKERLQDIATFERHLWRSGTTIRKFFLHVSRGEQRRRMLERLDDSAKNWKFSEGDLVERRKWRTYQAVYDKALGATSTRYAPWYVIPADHKWFAHALIADVIIEALEGLDLSFPAITAADRRRLARARRALLRDR